MAAKASPSNAGGNAGGITASASDGLDAARRNAAGIADALDDAFSSDGSDGSAAQDDASNNDGIVEAQDASNNDGIMAAQDESNNDGIVPAQDESKTLLPSGGSIAIDES